MQLSMYIVLLIYAIIPQLGNASKPKIFRSASSKLRATAAKARRDANDISLSSNDEFSHDIIALNDYLFDRARADRKYDAKKKKEKRRKLKDKKKNKKQRK
mmetsp:Transcript_10761/g.23636  ORF Transcript_10761/g.23636 Transcript_10761/m.23636 type:complete len:101 (-) Transcript_10761:208-510(-)